MTVVWHTDPYGLRLVDLHRTFPQFKRFWEADGVTKSQTVRDEWPWLMEFRGSNGLIHPFGREFLCAVSRTIRIGTKLRALPFIVAARGDIEAVVQFDVQHMPAVCEIIRPYRRRQMTDEQRQRAAEHLRRFQFREFPAHKGGVPALESTIVEETSVGMGDDEVGP